ncbi:Cytochrome c oxidase assembly protein CtaG [Sinobacterium norvegicum]|uniref:Cytochrome c oxidase assembly protein CtaG n=1 Tax=Sinobacterium norvegicum TaxID=1641715 RepID=A0ABN8EPU3_9GAMM|nr:cytochrome c oxidase assembly protein [Sinobacterium norvegicum]CAH0992993.1 Cytochrome c oxidase assembly protein CtaG [Sinobacterium norvegicum]
MAETSITQTVKKLFLLTAAMFGFGFLLVPIYDVLCDVTGLNGKTSGTKYESVEAAVDETRTVKIQFIAMNNDQMMWSFSPNDRELSVHPGALTNTAFYAKNPLSKTMIAQAVPSVSPSRAAAYFHKTECFCFNQQTLEAGTEIDMPLRFVVDQELPKDIHTITLSYTLFDVTEGFGNNKVATN